MTAQSWPAGTVVALATHGDGPHVIPVSAALRAADGSVWLALAQSRGSLARLRRDPRVAVLVVAAGNVALTLRGSAAVVDESLAEGVAAVRIRVSDVAHHERTTFVIDSGALWHWTDEQARARDADVNAGLLRLAQATQATCGNSGIIGVRTDSMGGRTMADAEETLYEHAGGDEALHRLEEIFYAKALADPVLKELFTTRVPTHVDHLTWFTAESFGGPARFTRELGFQYLIDVHRHLNISDEQRDRFISAYLESLDEAELPDDERFRQAVREHVEFGAHVAQQNSHAKTDAELHPIREVPSWTFTPADEI